MFVKKRDACVVCAYDRTFVKVNKNNFYVSDCFTVHWQFDIKSWSHLEVATSVILLIISVSLNSELRRRFIYDHPIIDLVWANKLSGSDSAVS